MIIDRYIVREVGLPFVAVGLVLLIIFATYSLTRFLMEVNSGFLLAGEVVSLTGLKSLVSLEVLLPLSFYFAVMIGMGRLYSDSEIYAMRSSGISEKRLMRPVMLFALALAVLTGVLSIFIRPWAYGQIYDIQAQASASSDVDRIRPARFYQFEDSGRTVFIENIAEEGHTVNGVFIRTLRNDDLQVISSVNGRLEYLARAGFHRLTLFDAYLFKRVSNAPDFYAELGSFSLWLPAGEVTSVGYKTKASSTVDLIVAADATDSAELQWRLAAPLSALLLALLAIPLSRGRPRQGRYARILLALVIYAVYFNLLDVSRTWVEQGSTRYIWWVPGIMLLGVGAMYAPWRKNHRKWKRSRIRTSRS